MNIQLLIILMYAFVCTIIHNHNYLENKLLSFTKSFFYNQTISNREIANLYTDDKHFANNYNNP